MPQSLHKCSTLVLSENSVTALSPQGGHTKCSSSALCRQLMSTLHSAHLQSVALAWNMAGLPGGSLSCSHTSHHLFLNWWPEGQWQICAHSCWGGRCSLGSVSDVAMLVSSLQRHLEESERIQAGCPWPSWQVCRLQ